MSRLDSSIFDNHVLKLWHDWQPLIAQRPQLAQEWHYERDEDASFLSGPDEALTRIVGNVRVRVILGGDGLYTPLAEMIDKHGINLAGSKRVRTTFSPERSSNLFTSIIAAEEAVSKIGQAAPVRWKGKIL